MMGSSLTFKGIYWHRIDLKYIYVCFELDKVTKGK